MWRCNKKRKESHFQVSVTKVNSNPAVQSANISQDANSEWLGLHIIIGSNASFTGLVEVRALSPDADDTTVLRPCETQVDHRRNCQLSVISLWHDSSIVSNIIIGALARRIPPRHFPGGSIQKTVILVLCFEIYLPDNFWLFSDLVSHTRFENSQKLSGKDILRVTR